jgi:hypothetical protein
MAKKVAVKKTLGEKKRWIYGEILQKKWGGNRSLSGSILFLNERLWNQLSPFATFG